MSVGPHCYRVELLEAGSMPWSPDYLFSRSGAWKRIQMAAREIVPDWAEPIWARVYLVQADTSETLVYSCNLTHI